MVKRLSAVIAVFFALTVSLSASQVFEKKLLGMVPDKSEVVLSVDLTELQALPAFKKSMSESRDIMAFTENTGFTPADLGAILFWSKDDSFVCLAALKKPFAPLKVFAAPSFQCRKVEGSAGIYRVKNTGFAKKSKKRRRSAGSVDSFCIAPLAGNVVAFAKSEEALAAALEQMKGKKGFSYAPHLKGIFRGVAKGGKLPFADAMISCGFKGANKSDLDLFFSANFNTEDEALSAKEQISMVISLLMMQVMQQDPDLAAEVVKCLRFTVTGKKLLLKTVVPGTLIERLSKFASEYQKKKAAAKRRRVSAPKRTGAAAQ